MKLEFNLYELKKDSKKYKQLIEGRVEPNEFVIVGEELVGGKLDCYKAQHLTYKGLVMIGGLNIEESAYLIEKDQLEQIHDDISHEETELDIPKEYLTLDIIENIQRLNEDK